jgi:Fusaric acid resistance protein family
LAERIAASSMDQRRSRRDSFTMANVSGPFADMLARAGTELPPTRPVRRDLTRRAIALDPIIDLVIGESSRLRYHSPTLQTAQHGLFTALDGWRCVATRLEQMPPGSARREAETIRQGIPIQLRSSLEVAPARWTDDPMGLQRKCEGAARALLALPAATPSLRLLAEQKAKLLAGFAHVFAGLALLVDARGRPQQRGRGFRLSVPDFLPAQISAIRAFLAIGAVELWVVPAWPSGAIALLFTAVLVLLFSPKGDTSYAAAFTFMIATIIGISFAATLKFAALPNFESFAGLCAVIGLCMVPVGFGLAYSRQPVVLSILTAVGIGFVPLLQPANPMTYNTAQYYNTALALFVGSSAAALAFALLPPPSPSLRTRRLLAFALRDLRGSAIAPRTPRADDWESRMYGRLTGFPDQAEGGQLAQLLATFSVGSELIRVCRVASVLPLGSDLEAALAALARGNSAAARMWLTRLDERLASLVGAEAQPSIALQARASILAISGALARHAGYFDSGAHA